MDLEVPKYPPPPPPAPKRLSRPKITLQIPQTPYGGPPSAASRFSTPNKFHGYPPHSPAAHKFHQNFNPEWYLHMTQASDFIMNTAKSGLSFGEKTALWIVSKLRRLSKQWFTHFFLMLCLVLYTAMGAAIFMALEAPNAKYTEKYSNKSLYEVQKEWIQKISDLLQNNAAIKDENTINLTISYIEKYESDVKEYQQGKTWTFINAMFYAGTIFTTIGTVDKKRLEFD